MNKIHNTAIIGKNTIIGSNVEIGPYCVVEDGVKIGNDNILHSSVYMSGETDIGNGNNFFPFCSIGSMPQDLKYQGEKSKLTIGDRNIFREHCTANPGTSGDNMITIIGNSSLFMIGAHIAHDCIVGDNTVFANNVGISGHVQVGDWAILGGYAGVNQFLKIGAHAMVGAMTHITNDIPAFMIVSGRPATVRSINAIGLERRGLDKETIVDLREAYKIIYKRNYSLQEAIDQLKAMREGCETMQVLIDSLESSEKGIHR